MFFCLRVEIIVFVTPVQKVYRGALRYPGGSCGVPDGRERRTHLAAIILKHCGTSPVRSRTSHGLRAALAAQFGHTSIPAGDTHTETQCRIFTTGSDFGRSSYLGKTVLRASAAKMT